jgi:hypothetical protein
VHIVTVDVSRTVSSSLGPALRHPVRSRILLPRLRTTGKWRILLPRPFATTSDLDFGPFHQAPSSDGASFFALQNCKATLGVPALTRLTFRCPGAVFPNTRLTFPYTGVIPAKAGA